MGVRACTLQNISLSFVGARWVCWVDHFGRQIVRPTGGHTSNTSDNHSKIRRVLMQHDGNRPKLTFQSTTGFSTENTPKHTEHGRGF